MLTIKLVVIGASGVGKTSLRGKYISGRFSNAYRATIGADFIAKTLPHPTKPDESVTLQIWDTAGQERFSSLSSAFFRGADAALLMFDVNDLATLHSLTKWWAEFRDKAPLADDDMEDFCCVVVGNKTDLVGDVRMTVSEAEATDFLQQLVPISSRPPSPLQTEEEEDPMASSQLTVRPLVRVSECEAEPSARSDSISIVPKPAQSLSTPSHSPGHRFSKSRSRSSSGFYSGTMTTTHTSLSIYHSPSSSLFGEEDFHSARSSPEPWQNSSIGSPSRDPSFRSSHSRCLTNLSNDSLSSDSAATMTPSLFAREQADGNSSAATTPEDDPRALPGTPSLPPALERGPKLFFTSAKTGDGVSDVFEYISRRMVCKWEYEDSLEARRMHMQEMSVTETVRLGLARKAFKQSDDSTGLMSKCC